MHWAMTRYFISACALLAAVPFVARAYTGAGNAEATMTFDAAIRIDSPRAPLAEDAKKAIEVQVKHLFGSMTNSPRAAVPKNDHSIEITSTLPVSGQGSVFEISYHYTGTVLMTSGPIEPYSIYLPLHPESIATDAVTENSPSTPNACTDETDPQPEYFWYFWSPDREDCKLALGRDYFRVTARFEWKTEASIAPTYPEYDRLVQTRDGKKVIPLTVLIGKFDNGASGKPLKSRDPGAEQFASIRSELLGLEFSETKISKRDMKAIAKAGKADGEIKRGRSISGYPYASFFTKETPAGTLEVRLFYGNSTDTGSNGFFVLYQDALKNDAIMIYDGHSGLGDYLSLENLKKDRGMTPVSNPSIYQVFFFNSCTSYAYYNDSYLRWKASPSDPKGTKQLDILTNGLSTGYTSSDTNMVLVKAVHAWAMKGQRTSYGAITELLSLGNLIGVNGDEDNSRP
jgi:hypothetical protein